ncbi:K02A2.6-like [Cordylochernes scorpioides]|uniref:K02A2.6-like n=1 Tax=Cordylochernes scorpioides TaxID=51811 RepID=A0ABY6LDU0_9ARAC|nr:K02A2.6-like [Cordylochernes scorpioides]
MGPLPLRISSKERNARKASVADSESQFKKFTKSALSCSDGIPGGRGEVRPHLLAVPSGPLEYLTKFWFETKLNQNLRFNIKDYTTQRKDRPGKFGGGLAVLIKTLEIKFKEIAYNQRKPRESTTEAQAIDIYLSDKTIPILNVYNHDNTSINTGLIETLSEASSDIAIILSDFNAKRPTWGSPVQDNKEKLEELCNEELNHSTIDKKLEKFSLNIAPTTQWKILKSAISDHRPILTTIKFKIENFQQNKRTLEKIFTEKLEELCNEELNHSTIDKKLEKFSLNISKAAKVSIRRGRRKDLKVKSKMSPGDALIFGQMIKHFGDEAKNQLLRILKISWQTGKRHFLPGLMKDQPYDTIIQRIKLYLVPKKKVIPQRCRFLKRNQQEGESISEYLRELKLLAINCNFGDMLGTMMRDRFVAEIKLESLQKKLLQEHDDVTLDKVLQWQSRIDSNIEELTRECRVCQESASMPPAIISEWTWPEKPWHRLQLDLADNGRQFVSGEFEQFTKMNGIRHTKTSPYNPSTNGLAERDIAFPQTVIKEFPRGTANEEKFKIKIFEFNTKMRNPREVFHEAVRRQEQFTTGCEVYFRNYETGPKRSGPAAVHVPSCTPKPEPAAVQVPVRSPRPQRARKPPDRLEREERVNACEDWLLNIHEDPNFLTEGITDDETWVYGYDPETKRQSSPWLPENDPKPKKAIMSKSKTKVLLDKSVPNANDIQVCLHCECYSEQFCRNCKHESRQICSYCECYSGQVCRY